MQIDIVSVGTVTLLAQFDQTLPQDTHRTAIVLVEVPHLHERFVVWRVQEETATVNCVKVTVLHAFNGQYYADRSQALGRFIRRTGIEQQADV